MPVSSRIVWLVVWPLLAFGCNGDGSAGGPVDVTSDTADELASDGSAEVTPDAPSDVTDEGVVPPDFSCVDTLPWPLPSEQSVDFDGLLLELASGEPLAAVSVTACALDDISCENPLDTATSGADGRFTVTLPTGQAGFDGYLTMEHEDLTPTLFFLWPPVTRPGESETFYVLSDATWEFFHGVLGVTLDPERGHMGLQAEDCAHVPAAGVSLAASTADESTVALYIHGLPTTEVTETDESGFGGFLNLPVGPVTLSGSVAGEEIGAVDVFIRAGFLSDTSLAPRPAAAAR
jgi:hypothetical protein